MRVVESAIGIVGVVAALTVLALIVLSPPARATTGSVVTAGDRRGASNALTTRAGDDVYLPDVSNGVQGVISNTLPLGANRDRTSR